MLKKPAKAKGSTPAESAKIVRRDPFMPGEKWFLRTVTFHVVGRVVRCSDGFLVLADAAWIAESGRFSNAIKQGVLNEVEPVGDALVNIASIVDAFPWVHDLPTQQK